MIKTINKNSIVDGLENGEKIGGISYHEFYQLTFCCKSSQILNESTEPIDLSSEYVMIIKSN